MEYNDISAYEEVDEVLEHYLSFWSSGDVDLTLEESEEGSVAYSWTCEEPLDNPPNWSEEEHVLNISDLVQPYLPFERTYTISDLDEYGGSIEFHELDQEKSLEIFQDGY